MADTEWPQDPEELELVRLFFALPAPVAVPHGYQVVIPISGGTGESGEDLTDGLIVSLIFHQVTARQGRTAAAAEAVMATTSALEGLPRTEHTPVDFGFRSQWTVVEAMTTRDSPEAIPHEDDMPPAHWSVRQDFFARCLHATQEVVRAYRQATLTPCEIPSYVRIPSPVLAYSAKGIQARVPTDEGDVLLVEPTQGTWDGPQLIMLDHANLPDPIRMSDFDANELEQFHHWSGHQARNYPLLLWRERWIEARRAHWYLGEEGQAVILANTSCEVLLDVILALLMWEEGIAVFDAVPVFEEGKTLRRLKAEFPKRLKGNWSLEADTLNVWIEQVYRLRHRVVHGGYSPTVAEGAQALEASNALHQFLFDRIAARRDEYPRAALLALGRDGLLRRNMWKGNIRQFAEQDAPQEDDWVDAFSDWYQKLREHMLSSPT